MLMNGEGGYIDEITTLPFEALRLFVPIPCKGVDAIKFQVPMQIVAGAFDNENNLFPHMPMLARPLTGREELHVSLDTALLSVQTIVNQVLNEAIRRPFEWHVA